MNVLDMLHDLTCRKYNVQNAFIAVEADLEIHTRGGIQDCKRTHPIAHAPVIKTGRFRTHAGKAWKMHDGTMKIELARRLWLADEPWDDVRQTFIHELAHLFSTNVSSHGIEWQEKCAQFGIFPHRYHQLAQFGSRKIVTATCPSCGRVYKGKRRLSVNRKYRCIDCGTTVSDYGER